VLALVALWFTLVVQRNVRITAVRRALRGGGDHTQRRSSNIDAMLLDVLRGIAIERA
jgi:hypothetical protein